LLLCTSTPFVYAAVFLPLSCLPSLSFFFTDTATTEIYTLSLHDALPISAVTRGGVLNQNDTISVCRGHSQRPEQVPVFNIFARRDRKSTRLNSSHVSISYAVFCLKKKNRPASRTQRQSVKEEG